MYDKDSLNLFIQNNPNKKFGWICSCWDLIHPGHIKVLEDAKSHCDLLVVGLHVDPSIERSFKNKPIQSLVERRIMIEAIKYVDCVIQYETEEDQYNILIELNPTVRTLGDDYINKDFIGKNLPIKINYHKRSEHSYSTTELRKRIFEAELPKHLK